MTTQPAPVNPPTTTTNRLEADNPSVPANNNHPGPNGSPSPVPSRLPKTRRWSRRTRWLLAVLAVLVAGGSGLGGWIFYARKHAARPDLILHKVKKETLHVTITDRGSLEPADNTYVTCKVKAKTPGQASTSIRWVIDNGSVVKEGDKVLELDDSALVDSRQQQQILVYQADEALKKAELLLAKDVLANEAIVEQWKTKRQVAQIVLQEYLEGQFATLRLDLQNKRIMSDSDLVMWEERARWSDRMSRPGRQFVTASQAESDEARRQTALLTQKNFRTQLDVLEQVTRKKFSVQYQGDIDEAERQVKLAEETLEKTRASDEVAVRSAYAQYQLQESRLHDIEKEIENCYIFAPRDGMVIYYVEERARWGGTQGVIGQGELVKEGQKLVAVPDLTHMVVNARVHEAMISRVRDDKERSTGFSEAVNSALLFTPQPLCALSAYISFDSGQKTFSSAYAHLEKKRERRGMPATVRVNAFSDRPLKGHVKWVSPVASMTDFFSSDVKVYQTYVAIDDDKLQGLKPGMDAVVTIYVETKPEPVLAIPLQALLGGVEMGEKRRCFVVVEGQLHMREVTLGSNNETLAEVKEGLQEDDVVVLNPAVLLSDKEKAEYGVSASSDRGGQRGAGGPGGDKGGPGGRGKGKGKGKSGPGGFPGGGAPEGGFPGGGAPGSGAPGGGRPGGMGMNGGARGQGGAPAGGKATANPNP
jgi:multidrug efflux pump subunit AcrA (membrane-fusion protein)